jgi:hypothetical protein
MHISWKVCGLGAISYRKYVLEFVAHSRAY